MTENAEQKWPWRDRIFLMDLSEFSVAPIRRGDRGKKGGNRFLCRCSFYGILLLFIGAGLAFESAQAQVNEETRRKIVERAVARIEDRLGGRGFHRYTGNDTFLKMRPGMAVADGRALYKAATTPLSREIPILQDKLIAGTAYIFTGMIE